MTNRQDILIEAKNVDFCYEGKEGISFPALSGINLALHRGEYLALIGPNGSGKTTLLKIFNALLVPSNGEVLVNGLSSAVEDNILEIRRLCGMIFQNPDNQLVATTVEEDIAFGLENQALPRPEIISRVQEVSSLLGLEKLMQHPPHLLSGGEKQKVAIAGVLAMQPQCILMDEPTAMLDPFGREDVLNIAYELNRTRDIAFVHVTHFPEEAARADRVVVFNDGCLEAQGSPEKILTDLELLHGIGLEGTKVSELAALLRDDGFNLPLHLLHGRELVDSLCSLERKS